MKVNHNVASNKPIKIWAASDFNQKLENIRPIFENISHLLWKTISHIYEQPKFIWRYIDRVNIIYIKKNGTTI